MHTFHPCSKTTFSVRRKHKSSKCPKKSKSKRKSKEPVDQHHFPELYLSLNPFWAAVRSNSPVWFRGLYLRNVVLSFSSADHVSTATDDSQREETAPDSIREPKSKRNRHSPRKRSKSVEVLFMVSVASVGNHKNYLPTDWSISDGQTSSVDLNSLSPRFRAQLLRNQSREYTTYTGIWDWITLLSCHSA